MKRISVLVLLLTMVVSMIPFSGYAVEAEELEIIYFEDGSYMTETIFEVQSRASGTKTGSKVKNYYDGNGNLEWKATLTGTFTYTGTTSTCTSSSCNVTVFDSAWYTISKSATKSGDTAYGTVTMGEKVLGITVSQVPASLSLKCDENGNLS